MQKVAPSTESFALPGTGLHRAVGLGLAALVTASWLAVHYYALFVFDLNWNTVPLALLLAGAFCWLSVGVFIVSHDAMHGSLAPGLPRTNAVIGGALLFLYAGFAWRKMRDAHFDHHKYAGKEGDPDFSTSHPSAFFAWYGTFFRRYFGWQSIAYIGTVVTTYWLLLGVPMEQLVLLYGLPAIASSLQLFYFGTFRPHRHDGTEFHDRHNARSETFGILTSLASCFHFGYHLEHHRRPDVPWWALPGARRAGIGTEESL